MIVNECESDCRMNEDLKTASKWLKVSKGERGK